jgi:hypothetical protein
MVLSTKATIACIHETKILLFDDRLVSEMLGQKFKMNFSFLSVSNMIHPHGQDSDVE